MTKKVLRPLALCSIALAIMWFVPEAFVAPPGVATVLEAFEAGRSGQVVELAGEVTRVLSDDLVGSRHQRFILRIADDHTVLVSHNIDLAPRVPLERTDPIELRGQYEWNAQGGVIHWTHHDPQGRRPGGWIRHQGETYR